MKWKALLVAIAAGLAGIVLATPDGIAAARGCSDRSHHPALLTITVLHMRDQPIRWRGCDLARGPIWDPYYQARPGQGKTMVMDGDDVTPVPGYGAHGPFYRLYKLRPGDLATIKWNGVTYTYRFVTYPFAKRQCQSKKANNDPRRYTGELDCVLNSKPIKHWNVEGFYIRCCWPRHTMNDFLYERAVLLATQP